MNILFADNDDLIRRAVSRFLRRTYPQSDLGLACSVDDAIALLQSHQYDVVVSDFSFGRFPNGAELLKWVRENRPGMRFLFVTGYEETARKHHPSVLLKPCSTDDLLVAIQEAKTC